MMTTGKLIGASLGPGDPGLITRSVWEALTGGATWAYPAKNETDPSFALDIANRAGLTTPDSAVRLVFPMTSDKEKLANAWETAAATVVDLLSQGHDVVFLVEGDASTYSTFGYLRRSVLALDPAIDCVTIPGVTSYSAAAATVGEPLADADDTLAIVPAGYGVETIEHLLDHFDTLALLKVKPVMEELIELVRRRGLSQSSYFVEKAGCPDQKVVHDITTLPDEKPAYLSLTLLKNPGRERPALKRGCGKRKKEEPA